MIGECLNQSPPPPNLSLSGGGGGSVVNPEIEYLVGPEIFIFPENTSTVADNGDADFV